MASAMQMMMGVLASSAKTEPTSVAIGGRRYAVVKIGNQYWTAENLDWKWDGLTLNHSSSETSSSDIPVASYYNVDEATYGIDGTKKCGLLYNLRAVQYLDDNRATMLPDGWRVPSHDDYYALAIAVGADYSAQHLKAADNSVYQGWPSGFGGDNTSGFDARPAGWRTNTEWKDEGALARFWTRTLTDSSHAREWSLRHDNSRADYATFGAYYQHSLRLVKAAATPLMSVVGSAYNIEYFDEGVQYD